MTPDEHARAAAIDKLQQLAEKNIGGRFTSSAVDEVAAIISEATAELEQQLAECRGITEGRNAGPEDRCTGCGRMMVWSSRTSNVPSWMCPECVYDRMNALTRSASEMLEMHQGDNEKLIEMEQQLRDLQAERCEHFADVRRLRDGCDVSTESAIAIATLRDVLDAMVDADLKAAGIDMGPANERLRQMVAKAREAAKPPQVPAGDYCTDEDVGFTAPQVPAGKTPGQVAYEAYCGDKLMWEWERGRPLSINDVERDRWEAAAQAVLNMLVVNVGSHLEHEARAVRSMVGEPRWIPVGESLPEPYVAVLISSPAGGFGVSVGWYRFGEDWCASWAKAYIKVTHWKPLPPFPEPPPEQPAKGGAT